MDPLETKTDFLEAGPLFTPGLRPDRDFEDGEFDPLDDEDDEDDDRLVPSFDELLFSLVLVLFMVIFMPSELGLTMYSEGPLLTDEDDPVVFFPSLLLPVPLLLEVLSFVWLIDEGCPEGVPAMLGCPTLNNSSPTFWADFNLSITALNEPFRFLFWLFDDDDDDFVESGEDEDVFEASPLLLPPPPQPDDDAISTSTLRSALVSLTVGCFNFGLEVPPPPLPPAVEDDIFFSLLLSREPPVLLLLLLPPPLPDEDDLDFSLEDDDDFELGELVADLSCDMEGFPDPDDV